MVSFRNLADQQIASADKFKAARGATKAPVPAPEIDPAEATETRENDSSSGIVGPEDELQLGTVETTKKLRSKPKPCQGPWYDMRRKRMELTVADVKLQKRTEEGQVMKGNSRPKPHRGELHLKQQEMELTLAILELQRQREAVEVKLAEANLEEKKLSIAETKQRIEEAELAIKEKRINLELAEVKRRDLKKTGQKWHFFSKACVKENYAYLCVALFYLSMVSLAEKFLKTLLS